MKMDSVIDEKQKKFEEDFKAAVEPLIEWLTENCSSTARVQVMSRGAELSHGIAWYVPNMPEQATH